MWDELTPDAQAARTRQQLSRPVALDPADPGIFDNFGSGTGTYFMRSMAEAGRGLSMLSMGAQRLAPSSIALRAIAPDAAEQLEDRQFRAHDELFGSAVDYWTPKPGEVGAAGQVLGSVAGGITQFLANPALAVMTAQMSTSEDLVRAGIDPGAALLAGDIAGLGTVAGIKIPILGKSLGTRIGAGVAGNVGQGAAQAAATYGLLGIDGSGATPAVRAQFDPFDMRARTVDALMGAAFGAAAHAGARSEMTQTQKDAVALVNQARHLEEVALPARAASEADLTSAVTATRQAIDQMLRGEPVAVAELAGRMNMEHDPVRAARHAEAARVVEAEAPPPAKPIEPPRMLDLAKPAGADGVTPDAAAPARPTFDDSVRVPTGEFDPKTGEPATMAANDFIAQADADLAQAKSSGVDLFRAAASCLLGSL